MRIIVVLTFLGVATAAHVEYDYQPVISPSADLPLNTDYPNVGALELNTFAPNSGVDSYGVSTHIDEGVLNKEFYHYAAPEEDLRLNDASYLSPSSVRKNLRVLFIKAPENNAPARAALQLAKQVISDRTAIYILSKQPDPSELAKEINDLTSSVSHKPEVHFVKYRTPEEAVNAQISIKRQYEALRGNSRSINEGIAPVLDFSSSSQTERTANGVGSAFTSQTSTSQELSDDEDERKYIPPVS